MKLCSCGRRIKQKYFKKCIHCQKADRKRRKEQKELFRLLDWAMGAETEL